MDLAPRSAAALVKPGGLFIFALYRKTKMCGFWKIEKKWYTKASNRGAITPQAIHAPAFPAGSVEMPFRDVTNVT
jgi:2-polyprenyl-6-hydroxyphenyl methylase/3-demethylubiquinone-9 3-methyltransferase